MSTKKTTKIIWRLANRPTPDEVASLFDKGLLNKDEAREILFSLETDEERTSKSLKEEVKFLRELIQKLSTNRTVIVETIREVDKPWRKQDWYQPYYYYANATGGATSSLTMSTGTGSAGLLNASYTSTSDNQLTAGGIQSLNASATDEFTAIKTF